MNITMNDKEEVDLRVIGMEMIDDELHRPSVTMGMETTVASALGVAVHPTVELRLEGVDAVDLEEAKARARIATNHITFAEIVSHAVMIETVEVKVSLATGGGIEMACEAAAGRS